MCSTPINNLSCFHSLTLAIRSLWLAFYHTPKVKLAYIYYIYIYTHTRREKGRERSASFLAARDRSMRVKIIASVLTDAGNEHHSLVVRGWLWTWYNRVLAYRDKFCSRFFAFVQVRRGYRERLVNYRQIATQVPPPEFWGWVYGTLHV